MNPQLRKLFLTLPIDRLLSINSLYHGSHDHHQSGFQSDFNEYKHYQKGDNIKNIDWKVYAKTQKTYVKHFHSKKAKEVTLLVDASTSMGVDFLEKRNLKKKVLLEVLTYFLDYLQLHRERFDLFFLQKGQDSFFKKAISSLDFNQAKGLKSKQVLENFSPKGKGNLKKTLLSLLKTIKGHSNVFLFSDFYLELTDLNVISAMFVKKKIHLHLVHLIDSNELKKNSLSGAYFLEDCETKEKLIFDWNKQWKAYRAFFMQHLQALEKMALVKKIPYHKIETNENPLNSFMAFFYS